MPPGKESQPFTLYKTGLGGGEGGGAEEAEGVWKWLYNSHQKNLHISTAFSGQNRAPTTPDQHLHPLNNVKTKDIYLFCCRNPTFSSKLMSHRSG